MLFLVLYIIIVTLSVSINASIGEGVVIIIMTQQDTYHSQLAADLKEQLLKAEMGVKIHLSHEDFTHTGTWTIFPILKMLNDTHGHNSSWLFFCDSRTNFSLPALLDLLKNYDATKEIWIGHALIDNMPTIIHHFAFKENGEQLRYPLFASGYAMSTVLLRSLTTRLPEFEASINFFSIDAQYELSKFIWKDGDGPILQHHSLFCSYIKPGCITYPRNYSLCGVPPMRNSIQFAVKTCRKFHKDRVPVVKETWGKHAENIEFFSDFEDKAVPSINMGIPNTEQGHCAKTFAIIHRIATQLQHSSTIKWIVIADDDTILSVSRLQELLSCFNPNIPLAMGERYGYNVHRMSGSGYNYITGGGGIVLSSHTVKLIAGTSKCHCPDISSPDDMFLGYCLASLGIPIIHIPNFHQARPDDYTLDYLESHKPVSFHKHWLIDPLYVYKEWFADSDQWDPALYERHVEL